MVIFFNISNIIISIGAIGKHFSKMHLYMNIGYTVSSIISMVLIYLSKRFQNNNMVYLAFGITAIRNSVRIADFEQTYTVYTVLELNGIFYQNTLVSTLFSYYGAFLIDTLSSKKYYAILAFYFMFWTICFFEGQTKLQLIIDKDSNKLKFYKVPKFV